MFLKFLIQQGIWKAQAQTIIGADSQSGITALAGGANSASTPLLSATMNVISTCATLNDSVKLPIADAGDELWVRNNGAAGAAVFPQSGGKINNGTADAALAVANAKTALFKCLDGLNWVAVITA